MREETTLSADFQIIYLHMTHSIYKHSVLHMFSDLFQKNTGWEEIEKQRFGQLINIHQL